MPLPTTAARSPPFDCQSLDGMQGDRYRLDHGGVFEGHAGGERVQNVLRDGDELGECAVLAVVGAGDAEHASVFAQVHCSAAARFALATENRGIESDPIADVRSGDFRTDFGYDAGRFVAHDDGWDASAAGAVVAVDIATADAAGGDADEDVGWADGGPIRFG